MTDTALSAEKTGGILFISREHEKFYLEKLEEVREKNVYHKSLVYCLGICRDTREHVGRIYDFKSGCVRTMCLKEG